MNDEPINDPSKIMRVLHVYRTYFPETQGGAEEVIRQICRNTSEYGVESRVLALCKKPSPKVLPLPEADIYRYQNDIEIASCGFSFSAFSGFKKLSKWADVINYHYPYPFSDILHCSCTVKAKTVVTYHSDIIRQRKLLSLYRPLRNKFFHKVDRVVATSPNYFKTSEFLNNYKEKVEVISLGLDDTSYPKTNSESQRKIYDQIGKDFFLFIGVLRYYKGLHVLIDSLKNSNVKAVIAGAGPIETELKEHVEKLGLKNIIFLGHVSDQEKVELIKLSRAIVFPSYLRSEAFGVTLIEGAMHGKPLISTEIGTGTSYVNIHNETGFVVSPGNQEELRNAMEYLDQNSDVAEKMGKAAKKRYLNLFTGKHMGKQYADLYMRLLTNQKVVKKRYCKKN